MLSYTNLQLFGSGGAEKLDKLVYFCYTTPMTENITLEISPKDAAEFLDYTKKLSTAFGSAGYGPKAVLWTFEKKIEQGKLVLAQKQAEEQAKMSKPAYTTVMCNVEKTAHSHDCWILHKPSKTVYYAPFGHHYQIIQYLHDNFPGVIDASWSKSDTATPIIRTGDVKHGKPRTAMENAVTSKKLRPVLIKAYYDARGQQVPGGPF